MMDVWAWVTNLRDELVDAGQMHVARLINDLPELVQESDPRVEAVAPELIAAARAMGNPWLEIYARHWHLQHRIGNNNEGTIALPYAVETLELAHREDTIDCPQSVCVTQDISLAYESIDPYGHAADREAVCRETLSRIDATWTCFDCLHRELCDALSDQGKPDEALALADQAIRSMRAVGEEPSPTFVPVRAGFLNELGRFAEAKALCAEAEAEADPDDEPSTTRAWRRLEWARACRSMGEFDEAMERLPDADVIMVERTLSSAWSGEVLALVDADAMDNTAELGSALQRLLEYSVQSGSYRSTVEVAAVHATLAARRGIRWLGEEAVASGAAAARQLRVDHGATAALDEARAELAAVPDLGAPVPLAEVAEYVRTSDTTVEQDIAWLRAAVAADRSDVLAAAFLGFAYRRAGQSELLLAHFRSCLHTPMAAAHEYVAVCTELLETDLPRERVDSAVDDVVAVLVASDNPVSQFVGHRMRAQYRWNRGDTDATIEACQAALALDDDAPNTKRLMASALMKAQRFAEATEVYHVLQPLEEEPGDDTWNLLSAATCIGDWATVRRLAASIGMQFEGTEGPIDEEWAFVGVILPGFDGPSRWQAVRTGPVTARVIEVTHPDFATQHFGSVVVFDASPVNAASRDEDGDDWEPIFPVVHTLQPSTSRSWVIDGPFPGDSAWEEFRDALRADGWGCWSATWPDYTLVDEDGEEDDELAGLFCLVAAPDSLAVREVYGRIDSLTSTWPHRPAFLALARAATIDVERHEAIIERFGL
jgi:tetratricopeptide (TPR) repeat protein